MRISSLVLAIGVLALAIPTSASDAAVPQPPVALASAAATQTIASQNQPAPQTGVPTELSIPSINLDVPVISVGLNSLGQMDVPSGSSDDVGWYDAGVKPGDVGSAVIDAHVFAAFDTLRYAKVGDDLYVTEGGKQLHFKITSSMVYPLASVPADTLFNRDDGRYLNLITCAGTYVASTGTYDHRLVDYAVLVN